LVLPVVFVLGWLASRLDLRQMRIESRTNPKAYFKGLNHLLNEQQDQAIDAFIEAVQHDPDTSELHFALGNLFRRRGEYERAVRVHQHLLSRGDLSSSDRERAQHALAMDYLKAGILDRAESGFRSLLDTALAQSSLLALLSIYERTQEWAEAYDMATRLEEQGQNNFSARRAHYLCELALSGNEAAERIERLSQAVAIAPSSARPRIALMKAHLELNQQDEAAHQLMALHEHAPAHLGLASPELIKLASSAAHQASVIRVLRENHAQTRSLDVLSAWVHIVQQSNPEAARSLLAEHLQQHPSLSVATQWLSGETFTHQDMHPVIQQALQKAVQPLRRYRCAACGFEANRHFWHCPGCQAWDSFPPHRIEER
jgi:lipopolysaccharide biosynthesis regulator YciM